MLSGKKVLLGVTGSIAAYKSTYLVRHLIKAGAEVKVILTPAARDFVSALTLATLSKNPVLWEYFDDEDESGQWHNHVDLGLWADLMIIAPATSNTLGKMNRGIADNFLLGVYMSAKCPVYFAPAMDRDMYAHPSTQNNISQLQEYGNHFIPSESGELASGLSGEGRMAEPENIIAFIESHLRSQAILNGKKVMITAGPTHEPIDPVRFIGNHSSGKTGIALAESAARKGAEVTLLLGPTHLKPTDPSVMVERFNSAKDLLKLAEKYFNTTDLAIFAAAVADYRVKDVADQKIKKDAKNLQLGLVKNHDVLQTLGAQKQKQVVIGFALETENGLENARKKLHKKNCDMIVLNQPGSDRGFAVDTNEVTLLLKSGESRQIDLRSKEDLADEILDFTSGNLL